MPYGIYTLIFAFLNSPSRGMGFLAHAQLPFSIPTGRGEESIS
jgi:hypothetical protein